MIPRPIFKPSFKTQRSLSDIEKELDMDKGNLFASEVNENAAEAKNESQETRSTPQGRKIAFSAALSTTSSTSSNEAHEFDLKLSAMDLENGDEIDDGVVSLEGSVVSMGSQQPQKRLDEARKRMNTTFSKSRKNPAFQPQRVPQSARGRKENNGPAAIQASSRRLSLHSNASEDPAMSLAQARRQYQRKEDLLTRQSKKRKMPTSTMSVSRSLMAETASSMQRKMSVQHTRTMSAHKPQNISPLAAPKSPTSPFSLTASTTPPQKSGLSKPTKVPSQSDLLDELEYTPRLFKPRKEIKCKPSESVTTSPPSPVSEMSTSEATTTSKPAQKTSRRVFDLYERGKQRQLERRKLKERRGSDDDFESLLDDENNSTFGGDTGSQFGSTQPVRAKPKRNSAPTVNHRTPDSDISSAPAKSSLAIEIKEQKNAPLPARRDSITLGALSIDEDDDFLNMETAVLEQQLEELEPHDLQDEHDEEHEGSSLSASPNSSRYSSQEQDITHNRSSPSNRSISLSPLHQVKHSSRQLSMDDLDLNDDEDDANALDRDDISPSPREAPHVASSPTSSSSIGEDFAASVPTLAYDEDDDEETVDATQEDEQPQSTTVDATIEDVQMPKTHADSQIANHTIDEIEHRSVVIRQEAPIPMTSSISLHAAPHVEREVHTEQIVQSTTSSPADVDTILHIRHMVTQMVEQSTRFHAIAVVKPLVLRRAVQTERLPRRGHVILLGTLPEQQDAHSMFNVSCNLYLENQLLFSDPDVLVVPTGRNASTFYAHVGRRLEIPHQFYDELHGGLRNDISYELIVNHEYGIGERQPLRVEQEEHEYVSEEAWRARRGMPSVETPRSATAGAPQQGFVNARTSDGDDVPHLLTVVIPSRNDSLLGRGHGSEASFMTPRSLHSNSRSATPDAHDSPQDAQKRKCCVIS